MYEVELLEQINDKLEALLAVVFLLSVIYVLKLFFNFLWGIFGPI